MRHDSHPFSQKDHDDALGGSIVAILFMAALVFMLLAIIAWVLFHVLPLLAEAAWFAVESVWFLVFQLFG